MKEKSFRLNTKSFSLENELSDVMEQMEKELDYYLDDAVRSRRAGAPNMDAIMIYIEKIIDSYRRGLLMLRQSLSEEEEKEHFAALEQAAKKYRRLVTAFSEAVEEYGAGTFSEEKLLDLW